MYIYPRPYACKKCGFESNWSPDDHERTPRVYVYVKYPAPICPKCWNKWLEENLGAMERKQ